LGIRRNIDEDMTTGIANSKALTKPTARVDRWSCKGSLR